MERFVSTCGLFSMVLFAWLLSEHKTKVKWRIVVIGLALQFVFAVGILRTENGQSALQAIGDFFEGQLRHVDAGSEFVFGTAILKNYSFAFNILPTIIFFSSLMSILYYLGLIQILVSAVAWLMQKTLGTSGAESLSAAANIFIGQTEAPLVIRPYINSMTRSELMAVMVGGFATVSGGVLAAFVGMHIDAGHLVTASVISAPASLLIAKVMQPEIEKPKTLGRTQIVVDRTAHNLIEAAADGASQGLKLALNIAAMLIAFIALISMANAFIGWLGNCFNATQIPETFGWTEGNWSLEKAFSYLFMPFAWLMGIPRSDCFEAGRLLGIKMVVNEFAAYGELKTLMPLDTISERTKTILTYALCGFANFSSIGIQLGGIGGMAPDRRTDLAILGFRAMIGGTLAAFMTACVAGILID